MNTIITFRTDLHTFKRKRKIWDKSVYNEDNLKGE